MMMMVFSVIQEVGDQRYDFIILFTHPTQCPVIVLALLVKLAARSNYLHGNKFARYSIPTAKRLSKCSLSNIMHNTISVVFSSNYISLAENEIVILIINCVTMKPISSPKENE